MQVELKKRISSMKLLRMPMEVKLLCTQMMELRHRSCQMMLCRTQVEMWRLRRTHLKLREWRPVLRYRSGGV
jgi:hypothetical protein